jgi:hypothetical protein
MDRSKPFDGLNVMLHKSNVGRFSEALFITARRCSSRGEMSFMRFNLCAPRATRLALSLPATLMLAIATGCDSSDPNSTQAKAERQARTETINKSADEDSALLTKRKGKAAAPVKDIKGRLGGGGSGRDMD